MKHLFLLLSLASFGISAQSAQPSEYQFINNHYDKIITIKDILSPLDCLTINAYHEARSENDKAVLGVNSVVLNRVKDKRFPNTICDVVFQKHQFSWVDDNKTDKVFNYKAYSRLRRLTEYTLTHQNKVRKLTNYSNHYVKNSWVDRTYWAKVYAFNMKLGEHSFYSWL